MQQLPELVDEVVRPRVQAAVVLFHHQYRLNGRRRSRTDNVAVAIEMLLDLNTMSVEELVGRLRVAEESGDVDEETGGAGRLLLTEE
ncbi:hypothetical protein E2562_033028 [Oryza meyeriana var. granulata]|uniref:Uncharacterized protein n=1 Tax=Oryza meyeriana var. granulata TaxID=110450 RepID=A0A6G1CWH3_9ORYZ|nr:hypothetical protein E2562_033028 [Oryza meyeriana var. granulata]